jgi:sugar phosphate isomerase/epimerase
MKLGVAGLLPGDWRKIDKDSTTRVRAAGFMGASLIIGHPLEAEKSDIQRVKEAFAAGGLEVAQANGWYEALVNSDEALRLQGIQGLQALVRIARQVDAPNTYVRPGGLNPNGHWYGHPENHSPRTFERLVDSLKKVAVVAEGEGMPLAIEGHVLSVLDTPRRVRDLLDAVASPCLKFNTDPVNFIGTVHDVHDTRPVLNQLFDLLGANTVCGHAKDLALQDSLVIRIDEVMIGSGTLDYALFLRRFQEFCPDRYLLIEHLPDEKFPLARQNLLKIALESGVNISS